MARLRWIGRLGLAVGLVILGVGVVFAGGSAIDSGDWYLAPEPWIGIGLWSMIAGMAATAMFALLLVVVEPIGWLRLLAVPPALFVVVMWWALLAFGVPGFTRVGAPPDARPDVATILYSVPELLLVALLATLSIALPLLIAGLRTRGRRPA